MRHRVRKNTSPSQFGIDFATSFQLKTLESDYWGKCLNFAFGFQKFPWFEKWTHCWQKYNLIVSSTNQFLVVPRDGQGDWDPMGFFFRDTNPGTWDRDWDWFSLDALDWKKYRWDSPETKNLWDSQIPRFWTTWDSCFFQKIKKSRDCPWDSWDWDRNRLGSPGILSFADSSPRD